MAPASRATPAVSSREQSSTTTIVCTCLRKSAMTVAMTLASLYAGTTTHSAANRFPLGLRHLQRRMADQQVPHDRAQPFGVRRDAIGGRRRNQHALIRDLL